MTKAAGLWSAAGMANVLSDEKKQHVLALGRLGWSLRKIEQAGVRRETAGGYLRAAGVAVRAPRQVVLRSKPATAGGVSTDSGRPNPASGQGVSTDYAARPASGPARPVMVTSQVGAWGHFVEPLVP